MRKLRTEKLDPNLINLKSTLQQIIDEIKKTNHATLKNFRSNFILDENLTRNFC